MKRFYCSLLPFIAAVIFGCDSSSGGKSTVDRESDSTQDNSTKRIQSALKSSAVMLPSGTYNVTEAEARDDEAKARKLSGDRGVFSDMYNNHRITLLPAQQKTSLSLSDLNSESATYIQDDGDTGGQCSGTEAQKVCATACATATANAYAFAFAHASATACA
jgi:hypothetical protein